MTLYVGKPPPRPNRAGRRAVRGVLLGLLLWFLLWLVIGWAIRVRMERPVRFIGRSAEHGSSSAFATLPLHFGQTRAAVFDARHHKQEV
jgi:cytochrome b561